MRTTLLGVLILVLAAAAATATAQPDEGRIALGQRVPDFTVGTWSDKDNEPTLDKLKNHVVVLFFFRANDDSAEALAKISQVYRAFEPRGLRVVGLTPDGREAAEGITSEKNLRFIVGHGAPFDERYEVSALPRVYLLDTEGRLVARFHPDDRMEERILAQIRRTPPAAADSHSLRKHYDRAREAQKQGAYGKAYTLAKEVDELTDDESAVGKAAEELIRQLGASAEEWLKEAKQAAEAKDYDKAARILAELSVHFKGKDVGANADTEIGRLMGDRELKVKLRAALRNAQGEARNYRAAAYEANGRYLEALQLYREVTEEYEDTPAEEVARKAIGRIKGDAAIQKTIHDLWAEEEADRWLDAAELYAKAELYEQAREFYQRVVESHPSAPAATLAKQQLAKLPKSKPKKK